MPIEVVGDIYESEVIVTGNSIREINRLIKIYGRGRWRKMKGFCKVRLVNKEIINAEIHWYEAHGIGKYEFKIKRIIK